MRAENSPRQRTRMGTSCCWCSLTPKGKRKKKLHGSSCAVAKSALAAMSTVPLESIVAMEEPDAVLCSTCEQAIMNVSYFQSKADSFRQQIAELLSSAIPTVASSPGSPIDEAIPTASPIDEAIPTASPIDGAIPTASRKRPSATPCDESSHRPRLDAISEKHDRQPPQQPLESATSDELASPPVKVVIPYRSGHKEFSIKTPSRKKQVRKIARKSYVSLASTLVNSPTTSKSIITRLALKIRAEMKELSSDKQDSCLRDTLEAIKCFSWETIWLELVKTMPTLVTLLTLLVPKALGNKPLICLVASQLLKTRHQCMGLVQRAISVMLYGNGTAKQVFANMQPLNVCLSYQRTTEIVDLISEDHDIEVQFWADELAKRIVNPLEEAGANTVPSIIASQTTHIVGDTSDEDEEDITAPPFSPCVYSSDDNSDYVCSPPPPEPVGENNEESDELEDLERGNMDSTNLEGDIQEELGRKNMESGNLESDVQGTDDTSATKESGWQGFTMVGDNVDKNVYARFLRHEIRNQSHHYFNGYANKDRADFSGLSDARPPFQEPDPSSFLPSEEDLCALKEEFTVLISRILVQHMEEFKDQAGSVLAHIPSKYSAEMGSKSETIPLGVLLHNENKLDDMAKILKHYMTLVPTVSAEGKLVLPNGSELEFDNSQFHSILFWGDQLTVARIRGVQALRDTESKKADRFEGLTAVIADWHARMALLKAIWGELYKSAFGAEKGTMYQLRNLVNRTNVPKDPQDNMNAAEDYFLLLLHAHVVVAAKTIMKLNPQTCVKELARLVVVNYIRLPPVNNADSDSLPACDADGIYLYATELLTLGLLWHGYHDSSKEADGKRICRYWKFLFVAFKTTRHSNYAKEALSLLLQVNYTLSERERAQLLWSRCVNTTGQAGANIPTDLYMEHLKGAQYSAHE